MNVFFIKAAECPSRRLIVKSIRPGKKPRESWREGNTRYGKGSAPSEKILRDPLDKVKSSRSLQEWGVYFEKTISLDVQFMAKGCSGDAVAKAKY